MIGEMKGREGERERENKGPDVKTNYTKVQGAAAQPNVQSLF